MEEWMEGDREEVDGKEGLWIFCSLRRVVASEHGAPYGKQSMARRPPGLRSKRRRFKGSSTDGS